MNLKMYSNDIQDTVVFVTQPEVKQYDHHTMIEQIAKLWIFEALKWHFPVGVLCDSLVGMGGGRQMEVGRVPMRKSFIQWMPSIACFRSSKLFRCQFHGIWLYTSAATPPLTKDLLPFSAWAKTVLDFATVLERFSNPRSARQHKDLHCFQEELVAFASLVPENTLSCD